MWCGFVHFTGIKHRRGFLLAHGLERVQAIVVGKARATALCGGGCVRQLAQSLALQEAGGWT